MEALQPSSYPLRMPADLRNFLQEKADRLDRSLHWVIVNTLNDARKKESRTKAEER
ncbi:MULTISPECIES: Arc family DNA-binding protein [Pandoraea]|uniref:Arc family DNA-binding protein n=1 Tax=Pandoraea TaxID=93217 RepID=UPI001F5DAD98|nr:MULTISPECIES: Arc family DNA-binding protein [Pandoraea]